MDKKNNNILLLVLIIFFILLAIVIFREINFQNSRLLTLTYESINNTVIQYVNGDIIVSGNSDSKSKNGIIIKGGNDINAGESIRFSANINIKDFEVEIYDGKITTNRIVKDRSRSKDKSELFIDEIFTVQNNNFSISIIPVTKRADLIIKNVTAIKTNAVGLQAQVYPALKPLFIVLSVSLIVFWFLPKNDVLRQWWLVASSVIFLCWIQLWFSLLLFLLLAVIFYSKKLFKNSQYRTPLYLTTLIFLLILFLLSFKYGNPSFKQIFISIGSPAVSIPLGISYFFFRMAHTVLQWYRSKTIDVSFREFLCYILFLPTLPAGPIETLAGFREKHTNEFEPHNFAIGLQRIIFGLAKKIIIADLLIAPILFYGDNSIFQIVRADPLDAEHSTILMCLFLSMLYAYIDFSAYSDIAIGSSRLFGYQIMENFSWPIFKTNLSKFWHSWHASLTNWSMNEVYFPLLIMTRSPAIAMYSSFLVMGLWHNINLNWFAWAIHHGTGLLIFSKIEKLFKGIHFPQYLKLIIFTFGGCLLTILFVSWGFSFVIFKDWDIAWRVYLGLLMPI